MAILERTLDHLMSNVVEAAKEYEQSEETLSQAEALGTWDNEGKTAKRKAAELAIAIDGLSDRASRESQLPIEVIRASVSALCFWPGSELVRTQLLNECRGLRTHINTSISEGGM